jgi:hypothetical protein
MEDADLYVDYKNSGNTTKMSVKRLQSVKITDPIDKDMSGAMIFATVAGGTVASKPVNSMYYFCYGQDFIEILANISFALLYISCGILGSGSGS